MYSNHTVAKALSNSKNWGLSDIVRLFKLRLSLTVALSSVLAYLIVAPKSFAWIDAFYLFVGGLLTTFSAGGINQILEKDFDILMKRTSVRPVATGIMSVKEGLTISVACGLVGLFFLSGFPAQTGFFSMLSLILYAFIYTPLKRISAISVFVGAIPGALPIVIGCAAAGESLTSSWTLTLFAFQFLWQLPHFWAIAILANDDYSYAGFKMLPTIDNAPSSKVGYYAAIASLLILPAIWIPYFDNNTGITSAVSITLLTFGLFMLSVQLGRHCERKYALRLMLASIVYLPLSLLLFLIDKI